MVKKSSVFFKVLLTVTILISLIGVSHGQIKWPDSIIGPFEDPCESGSLINEDDSDYFCTSVSGYSGGVACPTGYYCCPVAFTVKGVYPDVYENITTAKCSNNISFAHTGTDKTKWADVFKDAVATFAFYENSLGENRGVAKVCSDGTQVGVIKGEYLYYKLDDLLNACPRGHVLLVDETVNSYEFFCAADPACCACSKSAGCVDPASTCNVYPKEACCDELYSLSGTKCVIPGTQLTGTCYECAGGSNPTPATLPPSKCDITDGNPGCCNGSRTGEEVLNCVEVYADPDSGGCISVDMVYSNICPGNDAAPGQPCWLNEQCASKVCEINEKAYKTCQPIYYGEECFFYETANCACDGDYICSPNASGDLVCSSPCKAPGDDCVQSLDVCCDSADGSIYKCELLVEVPPAVPPNYTCQDSGEDCVLIDGCTVSPDNCCDTGGDDYRCEDDLLGGTSCKKCTVLTPNLTKCSTDADCCPSYNPTLGCVAGFCVVLSQAAVCIGTDCGGFCEDGYRCVSGLCELDDSCAAQPELWIEYTGPIIDIGDLIARIYAILYPAGILLGLFYIVLSGYTLMTSQGDPNKVKSGQEQLTAAILGTLFIMLSLVVVRVIINTVIGAVII